MAAIQDSTIAKISGFEIACDLPETQGRTTGFFSTRQSLLVAVETANGTIGWGETWQLPAAATALIKSEFGAALLGEDVSQPRRLWNMMTDRVNSDRHGVSMMAVSALDMAIWDATARLQDRPLSAVLGGALHDRLPTYGSGPYFKLGDDPYRDFQKDVDACLTAGFKAIKPRIGTTAVRDAKVAAAMRHQVGDDILLFADLSCGFGAAAAIEIGKGLVDAGFALMEEPVQSDDYTGYRRLSDAALLPIAGGESLVGLPAFRDFVMQGQPDLLQPDLAICGGITEALRIIAFADAFETPVIPHVWGTLVNFHAALQFAATLPTKRGGQLNYPIFEFDFSPNPLFDICGRPALDTDGCVAVPDGPGIGIELTPDMLEPFVVSHWEITT